jgi:hypothetical protein
MDAKAPLCIINPDMITRIKTGQRITELVGDTPLLEFPSISAEVPGATILGKAEMQNPGGSVKDRPALWMIRDGERTGKLTPEKTILDATSGNTGIAYAWIGAALGYKVKLCMPKNASEERKKILKAYGVDFVLTDPGEGSDGAIREARKLYAEEPDKYFYRGLAGVQMIHNILEQNPGRDLIEAASETATSLVVRVPHSSGMLEGKYDENTTFGENDHRRHRPKEWLIDGLKKVEQLRFLTESGERTLGQAALKFCLADDAVASTLPNIYDEEQLEEFAAAPDVPDLTEEELSRIAELYESNFGISEASGHRLQASGKNE